MSNANQCFFEPVESRALSGQRLLLNDIVMEIVAGCVDLACCENPVDKFSDTGFVVFGYNASTGEIWIRALTRTLSRHGPRASRAGPKICLKPKVIRSPPLKS